MPDFDHDPLQQLRELAAEGSRRAHGLPGEQVRALGARRHRRRMVAGAAAASVAVIVVAGGAFAAAGQLTGSAPPPPAGQERRIVPSPVQTTEAPVIAEQVDNAPPPGGWVTAIPAGYPLDRDLPDLGSDGRLSGPAPDAGADAFHPCDTTGFPDDGAVDALELRYTGPEFGHLRHLALYPDAQRADDAVQRLVDAVRDCPREESGDGLSYREHTWRTTEVGDLGVLTLTHGGQEGLGPLPGSEQHQLVRVGNAVLMVTESGEYLPGSPAERRWVDEVSGLVETMAADMCVFAQDPCAPEPAPSETDEAEPSPTEEADPTEPATTPETTETTPAPETQPEVPTLSSSVLLARDQTWYHERGDLVPTRTVHGEGEGYVSVCQRDSLSALGATDVWRRDFRFRAGGDMVMRTAALQFADGERSASAYATLRSWVEGCRPTILQRPEFDRAFVNGEWHDTGAGEFTDFGYGPVAGDEFGEMSYFDATGLVLDGDRVMVLSLVVPGQDWNWAYSARDERRTGLTLHPMFHMLPEASANLLDR